MAVKLGVNIDHVATLRQARRTFEPDPLQAAWVCEQAGAEGITVHLREDRRHIQDRDVTLLKAQIHTRLNLEMAVRNEMTAVALSIKPHSACLVPENRAEVTTEGGLSVKGREVETSRCVAALRQAGIWVSLFIDAREDEVEASAACGASHIELHTGPYSHLREEGAIQEELARLCRCAERGRKLGLIVNAGHGLNYHNVTALAQTGLFHEFNIGHSIVSRALFAGLDRAVRDMVALL